MVKIETLRREIKADIKRKNKHDLYVNISVVDVKANPRDIQIHK